MHPTPAGAYLNACFLYTVLTGQKPIDLPHDPLQGKVQTDEAIYLREIAWKIATPQDS